MGFVWLLQIVLSWKLILFWKNLINLRVWQANDLSWRFFSAETFAQRIAAHLHNSVKEIPQYKSLPNFGWFHHKAKVSYGEGFIHNNLINNKAKAT